MWTREALKQNAKQELRISYWVSFAVALVAGILGVGASSTVSFNIGSSYRTYSGSYGYRGGHSYDFWRYIYPLIAVFMVIMIVVAVLGGLYSIFIGNVLEVGKNSFFMRAPYGDRQFGHLFSAFKNGGYMSVVKAQFTTNLFIALWSLLFVIPGIIKSYEYRFVPYLLAENPQLSGDECRALSRQMTDGQKWEMFVLDLSFFGWMFLGALACGIGTWFVRPYVEATWAQLFFVLRQRVQVPPANRDDPWSSGGAPQQPPQQPWQGGPQNGPYNAYGQQPYQPYGQPGYPPQQPYQPYGQPGNAPQQPGYPPQQQGYPGQPQQGYPTYNGYAQPPQDVPGGETYTPAPPPEQAPPAEAPQPPENGSENP